MNWVSIVVIGISIYGAGYFAVGAVRVARSAEFKRDLERLREMRRLRRACRRS